MDDRGTTVSTLSCLVHRRNSLLEQWVDRLTEFLRVSPKSIGRAGGGHRKLTGRLDVAIIQSLVRKGVVKDCVVDYGHVIIDECHHLSAQSFELVAPTHQGPLRLGVIRNGEPQGRSSPHHLHAVWPNPASRGCEIRSDCTTVRALGDRPPFGISSGFRSERRPAHSISGPLP